MRELALYGHPPHAAALLQTPYLDFGFIRLLFTFSFETILEFAIVFFFGCASHLVFFLLHFLLFLPALFFFLFEMLLKLLLASALIPPIFCTNTFCRRGLAALLLHDSKGGAGFHLLHHYAYERLNSLICK